VPNFEIAPPPSMMLERVHRGLRALPEVESVAGISLPLLNSVVLHSVTIAVDGAAAARDSVADSLQGLAIAVGSAGPHVADGPPLSAAYFLVTPDFFTSIKAHLVHGRDFAERDSATAPWVAIVNESAVRHFWRGENPLGRRLRLPDVPEERWREVIGVVRDIPLTRQSDTAPVIYTPYLQQPSRYPQPGANMFGRMTFMIRTSGDPMRLLPGARRVVAAVDPGRPLASVSTMQQQLGAVVPQRGYLAFATSALAVTAMLLAAIGIYGVMAYSVSRRTREIGIRMALGATAGEVLRLVGRRVLTLLILGMSAGMAAALAFTRLLQSQLWGVTPTDPMTFAAAIAILALVATAAAFFPIRRAMGVNPSAALRCE
jgi:putative ABC transport system permease protein